METQEYISTFKEKTGRLPSQVELSKELGLSPSSAITALMNNLDMPTPPKKEEKATKKHQPNFLVVGMFTISGITFILSIYFTGIWFLSMFNIFIAGMISVSMVSYMVLSPQVVQHVPTLVKIPLWTTFGIALVFSMGSTIAGQYNQIVENVDVESVNERLGLTILQQEEQDLATSIEVDQEQRAFHQRTLESLSRTPEERIENSVYIRTERNMINELGFEILQKQERLTEVRAQILLELSQGNIGATIERSDFYGWFSQLLMFERSFTEFLVSALPAIFIDIIAALSLNIALGLRNASKIS